MENQFFTQCYILSRNIEESIVNFWYIFTDKDNLTKRYFDYIHYSSYRFCEKNENLGVLYSSLGANKRQFQNRHDQFVNNYNIGNKNDWSGLVFKEKIDKIQKFNGVVLSKSIIDYLHGWYFFSDYVHSDPKTSLLDNDFYLNLRDDYFASLEISFFLFFFDISINFNFKTFEDLSFETMKKMEQKHPWLK